MKDYSKVEHMKISIAMLVLLSVVIMVMLSGCGSSDSGSENFTVSGNIYSGNSELSGVTVTLSGAGSGAVTTDSNGNYSFDVSNYSTYTVTPSLAGYSFSPSSVTVTIWGKSAGAINFSGSVI